MFSVCLSCIKIHGSSIKYKKMSRLSPSKKQFADDLLGFKRKVQIEERIVMCKQFCMPENRPCKYGSFDHMM